MPQEDKEETLSPPVSSTTSPTMASIRLASESGIRRTHHISLIAILFHPHRPSLKISAVSIVKVSIVHRMARSSGAARTVVSQNDLIRSRIPSDTQGAHLNELIVSLFLAVCVLRYLETAEYIAMRFADRDGLLDAVDVASTIRSAIVSPNVHLLRDVHRALENNACMLFSTTEDLSLAHT